MPKTVIIEASLVGEADSISNEALTKQLLAAFNDYSLIIPWVGEILRATVKTEGNSK